MDLPFSVPVVCIILGSEVKKTNSTVQDKYKEAYLLSMTPAQSAHLV